ncbi:MAG: hypothetical protein IJH62_09710 [Mogibacterium sp.]|nr:hypothetical protein [Mogibacterium sp.]
MNEQQFITSACIRVSQAVNSITQTAMKMATKSPEDEEDRQEIISSCSSILFLINHIGDLNRGISKPRKVERFFNVSSNGSVNEVSREEYVGSLEDNFEDEPIDDSEPDVVE